MQPVTSSRFHPRRWTALTWLAVFLWVYDAYVGNWPPFALRTVDSVTGELSDPIRYERLRDLPFPVGWPLYYVTPSYLLAPLPVLPVGAPLPPPAPSRVSAFAMVANFVLVAITLSALVYFLQKTR